MDILTAMKLGRLTGFQVWCVAACMMVITIDGFDVFVMGFVLPHLPETFFTGDAQRGYVLSAGLVGMALGAIFLSPLADAFGRRRIVISSLLVTAVGMLMSGFAQSALQLGIWRVVTGIGIGSMATSLVVLVQEYTPERVRATVFGIYAVGFPLGALIGGYSGLLIMEAFGGAWQAMFFFGAAVTGIAMLFALLVLPESVDFLVARNPKNAQAQIDRIIAKLKNPDIDPTARPARAVAEARRGTVAGLFTGGMYKRTLLLWATYACLMITYYFAGTWTPQLVSNATGDPEAGTTAGIILSLGGFIGAIAFSALAFRWAASLVLVLSMILGGASILGLAAVFTQTGPALVMTALLGIFTFIAITAVTTLILPLYPIQSRVTATGWMVGIGRLCSIASPIAAGYLLAVLDEDVLYAWSALPLFVGAFSTFELWRFTRGATVTGAEGAAGSTPSPAASAGAANE